MDIYFIENGETFFEERILKKICLKLSAESAYELGKKYFPKEIQQIDYLSGFFLIKICFSEIEMCPRINLEISKSELTYIGDERNITLIKKAIEEHFKNYKKSFEKFYTFFKQDQVKDVKKFKMIEDGMYQSVYLFKNDFFEIEFYFFKEKEILVPTYFRINSKSNIKNEIDLSLTSEFYLNKEDWKKIPSLCLKIILKNDFQTK